MDKSILVELCENLQEVLNLQEQVVKKPATHKVELVSQLKPDNYWLPMMHYRLPTKAFIGFTRCYGLPFFKI